MTALPSLTDRSPHPGPPLPLLLVLFIGSGCAALIYEIVWFQLLQLVIGSSAVSLGVLLGTFMGGMCLGSLISSPLISPRRHPLRVYATLELAIGVIGIVVLFAMPSINRIYTANFAGSFSGVLLRGLVAAICLLPPTLLMGATLPAIARWVQTTPAGVSWLGFFYGGNTLGAVVGCITAGFFLLRVYDVQTATFIAAGINASVAALALAISFWTPHAPQTPTDSTQFAPHIRRSWAIYIAIALSGLSALGGEVVWTRLLSLLLGGTVYTFSIILAVLLSGLGIGSSIGAMLARSSENPRRALGCCQLLLTGAIAWSAFALAKSLPYWPVNPYLSTQPWFLFQVDLMRCVYAIFPAACLWGTSFPLALAAAAKRGDDTGRLVGRIYAANTLGAILGAIAFSIVLIPWRGTQESQRILIAICACSAALLLVPARKLIDWIALGATAAIICGLIWSVSTVPWQLVAYGRLLTQTNLDAKPLYVGEGINSTVAVTELPDGSRNFHVAGKVEASTGDADMRLQRMLGHLPAILHPNPRSILVVGCGAGVTAGSFTVHPEVQQITICEIEPLVTRFVADYFRYENHDVLRDPRVRIVYDDARHFVLTTREKFDIITSDPIHPWVKGAATLYTQEYFQMCKDHLNPAGLVTQWVPLYESTEPAVKAEIATFFSVFPNGTIWGNDIGGAGYDVVLLGSADASMKIDIDALQSRLDRKESAKVVESLSDVNFDGAIPLLSTYAGQAADLQPWLKDAQINLDRNLRLQYLAGLGVNATEDDRIYQAILAYRIYPQNLFTGSDTMTLRLRSALAKRASRQKQ
jgi:spermidine synthase